jgi:hypothetical protein
MVTKNYDLAANYTLVSSLKKLEASSTFEDKTWPQADIGQHLSLLPRR